MPPSRKLMKLNSKLKYGELYYFMCKCNKAKQGECDDCGMKYRKRKLIFEKPDKKEKEKEPESDSESTEEVITYRWFSNFSGYRRISGNILYNCTVFNCNNCGEEVGIFYQYEGSDTVYVVPEGIDEDYMTWHHFPMEEGCDDCNDICEECMNDEYANTPHLIIGENSIDGIYPENYAHFSSDSNFNLFLESSLE